MKQKVLNVLKSTVFLVLGVLLFLIIQRIFTRDFHERENEDYTIESLQLMQQDSVDVLLLGTSHMEYGCSPMKIYEDYGIRSYNLASSGQPIECSYYMLKYALETQKPKVVVLDPSNLFYNENSYPASRINSFWRYLVDNIPFGKLKIEMAKDYDKIEESDGLLSAFIPFIKYHIRWTELSKTDFNRLFKPKLEQPYYTAGFWICPLVDKALYSVDYSNEVARLMIDRGNKKVSIFDGNEIEEKTSEDILYEVNISKQNLDRLLSIKRLCDDNDANLALVKIPTLQMPNLSNSSWTISRSNYMKNISNQYNIPFYDLMYDYSSVVDFSKDTADKGSHLNFRGAEKVSCVVAEILRENFQVLAITDPQYDSILEKYRKIGGVESLETQTEFASYIDLLADNLDKWTVLMSVSNDSTYGMTDENYTFLEEKLGLNLFRNCDPGGSYIAVISEGKLMYESSSNQVINHAINIKENKINLLSSNWLTSPKVSIKINGTEYSQGNLGLNIVVFDNESNLVIDSVAFATPIPKGSAIRSILQVNGFTRAYEEKMCF